MPAAPQSVIHINFLPMNLVFDARPIWTALRVASSEGKLPHDASDKISGALGGTAIHLATRDYIMRSAVLELKNGTAGLCDLVPTTLSVDELRQVRLLRGVQVDAIRDRVLLAIDSFLYEYRAFLDLLAKFCHQILKSVGMEPASKQKLSSGQDVTLKNNRGVLKEHAFLLYLCDQLQIPAGWYEFLSKHRNFFTHSAAPYCAIEDRLMFPPEYDLLIMRTNIVKDYFRLSECSEVLNGIRSLGNATQQYLIETVRALS
jgi:hypothetical protein